MLVGASEMRVGDVNANAVAELLRALSPHGRAELERVLTVGLHPVLTPADRRLAELGPLAVMLRATVDAPTTERTPGLATGVYDESRPPGAPSSATLSERYGSWRKARRAAAGLLPDGRWKGRALPWPRRAPPPAYALDEVRAALRRCALGIGRRPTVEGYLAWRRGRGQTAVRERLPAYAAIRRHYRTWRHAQRDIPVTDLELAAARALRLPVAVAPTTEQSAVDALAALSAAALLAAGFSDDERTALLADGVGALSLPRAGALAALLGGSPHWFAGMRAEPGTVTAHALRFQPARVRALRRHRSVSDATAREVAGYAAGPWAAVMRGTRQPSFGAVCRLAELFGVEVDDLCTGN